MKRSLLTALLLITAVILTAPVFSDEPLNIMRPEKWTYFHEGNGEFIKDVSEGTGKVVLTIPPTTDYGIGGLWTSISLPPEAQAGDVVVVTWDIKIRKDKAGPEPLRAITRLLFYEPGFLRIQEHRITALNYENPAYQTAYVLNDPVPAEIYVRFDHIASTVSPAGDYVEIKGASASLVTQGPGAAVVQGGE